MTGGKSNVPASVAARLLHQAKQTGDVYQTLLTSFCFERFLHRLGKSEARERFVLKGAMLLRLWSDQPYRATRDLDLLRKGDGSFEAIRSDIWTICAVPVEPDAVVFDADAIRIETIRRVFARRHTPIPQVDPVGLTPRGRVPLELDVAPALRDHLEAELTKDVGDVQAGEPTKLWHRSDALRSSPATLASRAARRPRDPRHRGGE